MKNFVKMSVLSMLATFFITIFVHDSSAAALSISNIRVGLETKFQEAAAIPIGNKTVIVGYESNGEFLPSATVSANSSFSVIPATLLYCRTSQIFASMSDAQAAAAQLRNAGYRASPALLDSNTWTVYIGSSASDECANNAQQLGGIVQPVSQRRTALLDGDNTVVIFDNTDKFGQIMSPEGIVLLGDRKYRGAIEFNRFPGKNITPVNVLNLDDYALSAVPSEMPQSWHIEALKAQAVTCRTYAISRKTSHNKSGYDLCDKVHCQVYLGAGNEAESSTRAVRETAGQLLLYGQTPVNAVYCSSSGGYTDDSENVWTETVPYLRAVKEINEPTAKEWTRTYTLDQLTSLLTANDINIGSATSVMIQRNKTTGRVSEMKISATGGSKVLKKEEIRTFFNKSKEGMLESRNFTIPNASVTGSYAVTNNLPASQNNVTPMNYYVLSSSGSAELNAADAYVLSPFGMVKLDDVFVYGAENAVQTPTSFVASYTYETLTANSGQITLMGRGYGAGVGMSQNGAKGMAEMGYNYKQILEYYYTGTKVS